MTIFKLALVASAMLISGVAFASSAPEGNGHVDIASYAAPEGTDHVDTASYAAPEGNGHADVASYAAPEGPPNSSIG
jgi:hypothetical protein